MEDLVIAGGTEMMLQSSLADPRRPPVMDSGNLRLRKRHPQTHQGVCADAIATMEGINRAGVDELALVSQQRADAATRATTSASRLVPVYREDGSLALDREEFPRPQTTLEGLSALKPRSRPWPTWRSMNRRHLPRPDPQKYPDVKIESRPPRRQFVGRRRRLRRRAARLAGLCQKSTA